MPDEPAPGWQKSTVKLATTHRWKSSPGHNILVLEAGAMRIEYPSGWHVIPTNDALAIHDRKPPDDECRAQITLMRLPMAPGRNWDEFPLETLFAAATADIREKAKRKRELVHDITTIQRPDMTIVWTEHRWFDHENGNRPILCRQFMARSRNLQPFVTFDYYESRAEEFVGVWHHMLKTLKLGAPVSLQGDLLN